jgi:hypothetical protein
MIESVARPRNPGFLQQTLRKTVLVATVLDAAAKSRLRHRLRASNASELCWMTRRRATVHRMRDWGKDEGLLPSGVSALRDTAMSELFDLTAVDRGADG